MSVFKRYYLYSCILLPLFVAARSAHRYPSSTLPTITTQWAHATEQSPYHARGSHLEEYPTFTFNLETLKQHLLPDAPLSFRNNPDQTVDGKQLSSLIERVVEEVRSRKTTFTDFIVLQRKNFNHTLHCGLLVLKFKHYPFVVKLFMESPQTFMNPYCKGIEPLAFFFMGGGAGRHTSGLTRIPNLEYVKTRLNSIPRWKNRVEFPRKWFWLPNEENLMRVEGFNIGEKAYRSTILPATYAIIADAIEVDKGVPVSWKIRNKISMQFCNDLDVYLDPHIANFVFFPGKRPQDWRMIIIDTEHFPTIVGMKKKKGFRSHSSWYQYLTFKFFKDTYFSTKKQRRARILAKHELAIPTLQP